MRFGEIVHLFLLDLAAKVKRGEASENTHAYYRQQLQVKLVELEDNDVSELKRAHIIGLSWHSLQALKRLFNWAVDPDIGLIQAIPFKIKLPQQGARSRVLSRAEALRLWQASPRCLRWFIFGLSRTMARPGELRQARWSNIQWDRQTIQLLEHKTKRRTKEARPRIIPLSNAMLSALRRRADKATSEFIFLTASGKQWTKDALRMAFRRACRRAGLEGTGERIVPYTLRHTAATRATAGGLRDRTLADVLGHTQTKTTARYQHLDASNLVDALNQLERRRKKDD